MGKDGEFGGRSKGQRRAGRRGRPSDKCSSYLTTMSSCATRDVSGGGATLGIGPVEGGRAAIGREWKLMRGTRDSGCRVRGGGYATLPPLIAIAAATPQAAKHVASREWGRGPWKQVSVEEQGAAWGAAERAVGRGSGEAFRGKI